MFKFIMGNQFFIFHYKKDTVKVEIGCTILKLHISYLWRRVVFLGKLVVMQTWSKDGRLCFKEVILEPALRMTGWATKM